MDERSEAEFLSLMAPELASAESLQIVSILAGQLVAEEQGCQIQAYEYRGASDCVSVRLTTQLDLDDEASGLFTSIELCLDWIDDSLCLGFDGNGQLQSLSPIFEDLKTAEDFIEACQDLRQEADLDPATASLVLYLQTVLEAVIQEAQLEDGAVFKALPGPVVAVDGRLVHPAQAIKQATRAQQQNGHWLLREVDKHLPSDLQLGITLLEPRGIDASKDRYQPILQIELDDFNTETSYLLHLDQTGDYSLEVTPMPRGFDSDTGVSPPDDLPELADDDDTEKEVNKYMKEFATEQPRAEDVKKLIDVMTAAMMNQLVAAPDPEQ
jgi:hypothetical protein